MSKTKMTTENLQKRNAFLEAQLDVALAKIEHLEEEARIKAHTDHIMARRRSYGDGYRNGHS